MDQDYLEIKYISPVSHHKFCNKSKYYLVFIGSYNDTVVIQKVEVNITGNVDSQVRAFVVNKTVVLPKTDSNRYAVKLFKLLGSRLELIFTGFYEGTDTVLTLVTPSLVNNKYRYCNFVNDTSFLSELFFNFESTVSTERCVVFLSKIKTKTKTNLNQPILIQISDRSTNTYVFDRDNSCLIKETTPYSSVNYVKLYNKQYIHTMSFMRDYCLNKTKGYTEFIETYQIDVNKPKRQVKYDDYKNNLIVAPCDSRIRGFRHTDESTKFMLFNQSFSVKSVVQNCNEVYYGSGFLCRVCPQDCLDVFVPYISTLKTRFTVKREYYDVNTFRFESNYFIPPSVHERSLLAVVSGHDTYGGVGVGAGSRSCPNSKLPQPDTKLVFYVVVVGSFTVDPNIKMNSDVDAGDKLGQFTCGGGAIIFLCNRQLKFLQDVNRYSNMFTDTKIKALDLVSEIL